MSNFNIKVLLLNIKNNIALIESGEVDANLLISIKKDYLEMMELIKLFLISKRDVYYGYFLMNLQVKVNFKTDSIAGIKLNTYPPVLEVNPLILCKFDLKEIIYVICHEIEHVILNHPSEMVKINPTKDPTIFEKFNYAADASVNDRLNNEIFLMNYKFMTMPKGAIDSNEFKNIFKLKRVYSLQDYLYYYKLIERKNIEDGNHFSALIDSLQANNEGDSQSSNDESNPLSNYSKTIGDFTGNEDHKWSDEEEYEEIVENTKTLINESYKLIDEEARGCMPGSFLEEVQKINTPPKISWQSILKKYVGTVSANYKKTKTRLNRRQPERFDLSGKMHDKTLKMVIAIDTSASMSNEIISFVFNEIFSIISRKKYDITVIECDSSIQKIYKARNIGDVKMMVEGRGGTSFSPVIKYINENKYYRDALLIYFTDGFGEDEIPKPLTYRNLWVIIGDEEDLSLKEPYGNVLSMNLWE